MDGQLHIALDLQSGQHQVVPFIRQIIRRPLQLMVNVDDPVGNVTDMHLLIGALFKVKAVKMHLLPLIGQHDIYDKIPQFSAVVISHCLMKMPGIQRVNVSPDIVHHAVFFLQ